MSACKYSERYTHKYYCPCDEKTKIFKLPCLLKSWIQQITLVCKQLLKVNKSNLTVLISLKHELFSVLLTWQLVIMNKDIVRECFVVMIRFCTLEICFKSFISVHFFVPWFDNDLKETNPNCSQPHMQCGRTSPPATQADALPLAESAASRAWGRGFKSTVRRK